MKFSAIILSGGKSSRMKTDKSGLLLGGRTLLEIQVKKLLSIGCRDIIISWNSSQSPRISQSLYVTPVPDLIPDLGPMGGLYSCFPKCSFGHALVISVDVPLISERTLKLLLLEHQKGNHSATILSHNRRPEPLIGVYNTCVSDRCAGLIEDKKLAVRDLLKEIDCQYMDFDGNPNELLNCNTPKDYERVTAAFSQV